MGQRNHLSSTNEQTWRYSAFTLRSPRIRFVCTPSTAFWQTLICHFCGYALSQWTAYDIRCTCPSCSTSSACLGKLHPIACLQYFHLQSILQISVSFGGTPHREISTHTGMLGSYQSAGDVTCWMAGMCLDCSPNTLRGVRQDPWVLCLVKMPKQTQHVGQLRF